MCIDMDTDMDMDMCMDMCLLYVLYVVLRCSVFVKSTGRNSLRDRGVLQDMSDQSRDMNGEMKSLLSSAFVSEWQG